MPDRPLDPSESQADAAARLRASVLIEADELGSVLEAGERPVILAVRTPDAQPSGPWDGVARIPASLDAFLATELSGPGGGLAGSRPLPDRATLQRAMRRWGLRASSTVVVYDHDGGLQAARAWWVLRWAGAPRVRLLNGGFAAWVAAGLPTATVPFVPEPGDFEPTFGHLPQIDADTALAWASTGVLIDSRMAANYLGGPSAPGEAPRGHIPGAVSVPAADNLDPRGRFLPAEALRALYGAVGADGAQQVAVYCGAGVSAAHDLIALASLGIDAPMYVGSWSAWSADPARPVARGPAA